MKTLTIIYLFLFLFVISSKAQIIYNNIYDVPNDSVYSASARLHKVFEKDSFYYSCGSAFQIDTPQYIATDKSFLIKTDIFGNEVFSKDILKGQGERESIRDLFVDDNFIYLLGAFIDSTENTGIGFDSYWYILNHNGDSVLYTEINELGWVKYEDILKVENGFYLLGNKYNYDTAGYLNGKIIISHIDTLGNIISTSEINNDCVYINYDFKKTNDNGLIIGGRFFNHYGQNGQTNYLNPSFLMKLDSNLNLEWQNSYDEREILTEYNSVEVLPNEYLMLNWKSQYLSLGDAITRLQIRRMDLAGNVIFEKIINLGDEAPNYSTKISSYRKHEDSSIIIYGSKGYSNFPNLPLENFLLKYNFKSDSIIWERNFKYDTSLVQSLDRNADLIITKHNEILTVGSHTYFPWMRKFDICGYGEYNIPIPKLNLDSLVLNTVYLTDSSLNFCSAEIDWSDGSANEIYNSYDNDCSNEHLKFSHTYTQSGKYEIKCTTLSGNNYRTHKFFILVEENLNVSNLNLAFENLKLYPNPVSSHLIIESENLNFEFSILDITGKEISLNKEKTTGKIIFDTQKLSSGVYFLNVKNEGFSKMFKFVKE